MGKITINEMHNSLFDYAQAVSDEDLMTENKTIVGAINEIYGKNLIADSIGEPLSNTDTFTKMSNDINGLLSTFKTNMMNNGITVESSDKFKSLIDKIATLADNEGKGIQFASGDFTLNVPNNGSIGSNTTGQVTQTVTFDKALDFEWTYFFIGPFNLGGSGSGNQYGNNLYLCGLKNPISTFLSGNGRGTVSAIEFSSTGFTLAFNGGYSTYLYVWNNNKNIQWYAIGVGEEDTTLRDSLASVLEDEGVDVTEEDTMADLIVKTDNEFDRKNANSGLDIISATELPATGKENQICVITNSPVEKYIVSSVDSDFSNLPSDTILLQMRHEPTTNNYTLSANGITVKYYFSLCLQNKTTLASYVYKNGQWTDLTPARIYFIKDLVLVPGTDLGDIYNVSPPYVRFVANSGLYFYATNYNTCYCTVTSANKINMTAYNKVHIVAVINQSGSEASDIRKIHLYASNNYYNKCNTSYAVTENFKTTAQNFNTTVKASKPANFYIQEFDFDITSWSGQYYFGITFTGSNSYDVSMYIQELYFY